MDSSQIPFSSDTPLEHPKDDQLGRVEFAKHLASALSELDASNGFVFALYGAWGSGKSTVINFVLHEIRGDSAGESHFVIIAFNPWWFSGQDQLLLQFFRELRAALDERHLPRNLNEAAKRLEAFSKALVPWSFLFDLGSTYTMIGSSTRFLSSLLERMGRAAEADIHGLKSEIDSLLREQERTLLIVIDDVDRLQPTEVPEIFKLVKGVANFPNTVYLLSFDLENVGRLLHGAGIDHGAEYLDKIVQVGLSIPRPDRPSLQRLFLHQLEGAFAGTPDRLLDANEVRNVFWDGVERLIDTPRDVNQLMNLVHLTYPLVRGEVNAADFLGIRALERFTPEIYEFIADRKSVFTGVDDDESEIAVRREIFDSLLGQLDYGTEEVTEILSRLFPRWMAAYSNWRTSPSALNDWYTNRRICSPDWFDVYFRLALAPGEASSTEAQVVLGTASNSDALRSELLRLTKQRRPDRDRRVWSLLDRIPDELHDDDTVLSIMNTLVSVADEIILMTEDDPRGFFGMTPELRLIRVCLQMVRNVEPEDARFRVIAEALRRSKSTFFVVYFVSLLGQEHGKYSGNPRPESERLVNPDHLKQLEQIGVEKIRLAAEEDTLVQAPNLASILYRLRDWGSEAEAQKIVEGLVRDDENLASLLGGFVGQVHSLGADDRVSRREFRIDLSTLQDFLSEPVEGLLPRIQSILEMSPNWLTARQERGLRVFVEEHTKLHER